MKRTLLILISLAVATSGCGRFSSNDATPTTLLGEGRGVGAGLTTQPDPAPTPTTAGKSTATSPPNGDDNVAPSGCPYTDPTSEIEYGGRLRLTLTVTPVCPKHADDISFALKATNLSTAPIHYDRNQLHFFSLIAYPRGEGRLRWEDTNCNRPARDRQTAGTLNPGESVSFSTLYPAPKNVADREKCRRLEAGGYEGQALFLVCDGDAYVDGYCETSKDTQYQAQPVLINVAGA